MEDFPFDNMGDGEDQPEMDELMHLLLKRLITDSVQQLAELQAKFDGDEGDDILARTIVACCTPIIDAMDQIGDDEDVQRSVSTGMMALFIKHAQNTFTAASILRKYAEKNE